MSTNTPQAGKVNKKTAGVFGVIFILAGIIGIIFSIWSYKIVNDFLADAAKTTGTVVSVEEKESTDYDDNGIATEKTMYYPKVSFKTPEGAEVTFTSETGSSVSSYEVGQEVEVLYDQANPLNAKLVGFSGTWLKPVLAAVFGVFFLVLGVILIRAKMKAKEV